MPGSITNKLIRNYNNVSDSILHYDFRLVIYNFLILTKNLSNMFLNVLVVLAEITQLGKLFLNPVSKTILSYIISETGFLMF